MPESEKNAFIEISRRARDQQVCLYTIVALGGLQKIADSGVVVDEDPE